MPYREGGPRPLEVRRKRDDPSAPAPQLRVGRLRPSGPGRISATVRFPRGGRVFVGNGNGSPRVTGASASLWAGATVGMRMRRNSIRFGMLPQRGRKRRKKRRSPSLVGGLRPAPKMAESGKTPPPGLPLVWGFSRRSTHLFRLSGIVDFFRCVRSLSSVRASQERASIEENGRVQTAGPSPPSTWSTARTAVFSRCAWSPPMLR